MSQEACVNKLLSKFGMLEAKPVTTPLAQLLKLSTNQVPKSEEEVEYMQKVP